MLIQVNETITVKLSAVCNINILKDKQVFNMCYTFTDKKGLKISDSDVCRPSSTDIFLFLRLYLWIFFVS